MSSREQLIDHIWQTIINPLWDPVTLERVMTHCHRFPNSPFVEAGAAIERILSAGISPYDLCTVNCMTAYEAVFGTLYAICDPGADNNDVFGLYEEIGESPMARWSKGTTSV
jgi:hypothetical protein